MSKITAFLSVFILCSFSLFAQSHRFGIKSGLVISNMKQQEVSVANRQISWNGKTGYQTGVFYNRRFKESVLSVQMELDYKRLGTGFLLRDVDPNATPSSDIIYDFENLGFSVLPRIDLFPESNINPNFMFGVLFDMRLNSELYVEGDAANSPIYETAYVGGDINQFTRKNMLGYVMAGGIEINTKPVIVTIEGRYSSLFTSVMNEETEDLPLNTDFYLLKILEDARHEYLSILIGFNFYF